MNAEIERALQELIDQHGIEKINAALTPLIGQFKWSEWQRVYNLAKRLNARKEGKRAPRRKTDALK
jgi:hypothetical protein